MFKKEEINVHLQGPKLLPVEGICFLCPIALHQDSKRVQLTEGAAQRHNLLFFVVCK